MDFLAHPEKLLNLEAVEKYGFDTWLAGRREEALYFTCRTSPFLS